MRKQLLIAALVVSAISAPAMAQVTTYDANPTVPFTYGTGNGYTPANAVVNTFTGGELPVRAHFPGDPAVSTGGTGIYTFALGSNVSFDYGFFGIAASGANVLLTNILTGDTAHFNPLALQDSQQLGFGFLNGSTALNTALFGNLHFNNMVNDTYRIDLSGNGQTVTAYAQLGSGAVAAVPEPATLGMMLLGFGAMGVSLRRRRRTQTLLQAA